MYLEPECNAASVWGATLQVLATARISLDWAPFGVPWPSLHDAWKALPWNQVASGFHVYSILTSLTRTHSFFSPLPSFLCPVLYPLCSILNIIISIFPVSETRCFYAFAQPESYPLRSWTPEPCM
ncbi:hypothetical protein CI102_2288 [Trichoderma harzianum]|uniref:Uncharacterized protein n=1 Tax=Trichoderma harzianum CBS 226.95 TaxID=983964 RepID=A0A2T4AAW9_TRIHA|nr:hypothetical protein M431DRAFT_452506 [Trichoderma harzianum CBS 226.95]PKK53417.1 hypothetical protein CI102_2288 [Trichoderma harzianum]PTB54206.1 hypothetical protein M431DRAFT_452506 [Trichoderma harzianum CBS 226.95]